MTPRSQAPPLPRELGRRIRAERERLQLSQSAVAEMLGVNGVARETYAQLEVHANPTTARLFELVCVVGMDIRVLLPELLGK